MHRTKHRQRYTLALSLVCFLSANLLSVTHIWLLSVTAPAPRPHAVLRLALPGLDIGADAWPAGPSVAGYVELWNWSYDGDDIQTIVQFEGSPAQPRIPRQRSRPPRFRRRS